MSRGGWGGGIGANSAFKGIKKTGPGSSLGRTNIDNTGDVSAVHGFFRLSLRVLYTYNVYNATV